MTVLRLVFMLCNDATRHALARVPRVSRPPVLLHEQCSSAAQAPQQGASLPRMDVKMDVKTDGARRTAWQARVDARHRCVCCCCCCCCVCCCCCCCCSYVRSRRKISATVQLRAHAHTQHVSARAHFAPGKQESTHRLCRLVGRVSARRTRSPGPHALSSSCACQRHTHTQACTYALGFPYMRAGRVYVHGEEVRRRHAPCTSSFPSPSYPGARGGTCA
jgi:hypothetical protein